MPAELLKALGTNAPAGGTWPEVFGPNADEYFHAWSIARYIGQVAAAGKAEYPLPMYVNAALRDPLTPGPAEHLRKRRGDRQRALDLEGRGAGHRSSRPGHLPERHARYLKVLELYARPDNALLVPETRGNGATARMCFAALGHGAIGWSPFGLDYTGLCQSSRSARRG